MKRIRIGGVPEHFNLPWHMAVENKMFEPKGIEVEWITFKGGTGAMCKALREGDVDMCVILTEGIIKDIIDGNPSKIVSKYINTPLIWGVHTSAESSVNYYGEIFDKNYAVSRIGSGSHLMPQVDAMIKEKTVSEDQFIIIRNLQGALKSLKSGETDVFYWEKYTTKPYVDNGELKCLGEFVTPWPCFVLAASDAILSSASEEVKQLVHTIHFVCTQFVKTPGILELLSNRYNQKQEDIENWFHSTEWATTSEVSHKMIENVVHSLKKARLMEEKKEIKTCDIVYEL